MPSGVPGTRASQSDRDRAVELLNAAFVDGQIDGTEHGVRVGRALRARRLNQLRPLTRDLQRRAPEPESPKVAAASPLRGPQRRLDMKRARWWAAGVLVVGAVAAFTLVDTSPDPEPERYQLEPQEIAEFVDRYRERFDSTLVTSAEFGPTSVTVQRPVTRDAARIETWTYDANGRWRSQGVRGMPDPGDPIDLADLDTQQLDLTFQRAERELGVTDGEVIRVSVLQGWGGLAAEQADTVPRVEVTVSNEFVEQGDLATDLSGREQLWEKRWGASEREEGRPQ